MRIVIRSLDGRADRTGFRSGVPALDEWLERQAGQAQQKRLASVWIASPPDQPELVLGFYSLAPWQIAFEDCPGELRKRLPRYPIQVSLIARLAVAIGHQGKGLGGILLLDGLKRAWIAGETLPVQAVLVHAKDDRAAEFYRRYGFKPFPNRPLHLYLPMGTVEALFTSSG